MASDEQRVRTMAGWIGVEISRSRVRTPGKAGYGLYRVRGSKRADPLDFGEVRELDGSEVPDIRTYVPTGWTAYAFTLVGIEVGVRNSIEQGRPARPMELRLVEAGSAVKTGAHGYAAGHTVPTRWTQAYRGRRDLGVAEVAPVELRPEAAHRVSALVALLDEGLLVMHHDLAACLCEGTRKITMACVDVMMRNPYARGRIRERQAGLARAQEVPGFGEGFEVPCEAEREPDGERCTGTVGFAPGDMQARCDTCRAWVGRQAPSTVRSRQRAANAEFQAEHLRRRAYGLEQRYVAKRARNGQEVSGSPPSLPVAAQNPPMVGQ